MRLLSVDLERYGPFTGDRLVFRPDARLHVVFGPNEAGKSCALAAVTDLLFGIERATRYDFLHPGKELRIGARICSRDGRELAFRRRKNKPVLTDVAEAALPDDALAPFVGGLSRDVFCRAFGLDAVALRKSGDELQRTEGELGAALFSAASGLRGFADTKGRLEKDADRIFAKTRSQTRLFYQALDRYEAARKLVRERETRAGALKELRETLDGLERRSAEIKEQRSRNASGRARLERLRRAAPVIAAIDALEDRLRSLGDLPPAAAGVGGAITEAIARAATAADAYEGARTTERRLAEALAQIVVDQAVLDSADAIEALLQESGAYQKAMRDLPAIEREEDGVTRALADLAARSGLPDVESLLAGRPDDASRARVNELVIEAKRLQLALDRRISDAARERDALDDMKRERERRGALRDPRPLRERLAALTEIRRLAALDDTEAPAIAVEAAALTQAASRLRPAVADLDRLAIAALPARETVTRFDAQLAALDEDARTENRAAQAVREEIDTLTVALAELSAGGPVPTAERIDAIRAERDRHWTVLAATLFGGDVARTGPALAEAVAGFETAKREADRLADAAVSDAQRVASHAQMTRRLAVQETQRAEIEARRTQIAEERASTVGDWKQAWAPAGIEPLAPAEMARWSLQAEALLERRDKLQGRRAAAARVAVRIEAAAPAVAGLSADLGLPAMTGLGIEGEAHRIEREITRLADAWEAARESDTLLADLEARVGRLDAAVRTAQQDLADWDTRFRAALPRLGLSETATVTEAEAVLAVWKEVPGRAIEREGYRRRIAGMKRDMAAFRQSVRVLASGVAPDLADSAPDAALRTLQQRLTVARDASTRRGEVTRRLEEARTVELEAADATRDADRALAALAEKIGVPVDSALDEIARKLADQDGIVASLAQRREELTNAADGRQESMLREALASHDSEAADAELRRIEDDDATLERDAQETFAAQKAARERLRDLEGAVEAEVALQQRRGAEAEMVAAARDWAVLSIGALMMGTAMNRQRIGRQEPLMVRAGQLFAILTGGAYDGLGQHFDDDDVPHLTGRRAGGAEVDVTGMSEGTRDQLYLALRLAYLEDYAKRVEPPPFLGDDICVSFDDHRTKYALQALASVGTAVQPILFSHHRFVVDTAEKALGGAVDIIELR